MTTSNDLTIGFLHPGKMGISLAVSAQNSGFETCWASQNRSQNTQQRAQNFSLRELHSISELCQQCEVIVSICPPHAAQDVANQVLSNHFKGVFVEANAISPELSREIGEGFIRKDMRYVDASVIGPPAWKTNTTWLHLSGPEANTVAKYFSKGPLQTNVIDDVIGKASALKMCFAARSKGTIALLSAIVAASEHLGIRRDLEWQWDQYQPGFTRKTHSSMVQTSDKAWRFVGEMNEIASTFAGTGLPDNFHLAAADIYGRMAEFKDQQQPPDIEQLINVLLKKSD